MSHQEHERAIDLITRRGTEDIAIQDQQWVDSHLQECSECARYAEDFDGVGQLLRSVAVTASPALVSVTQARVRARAAELQEQRSRTVLIAVSFCVGSMFSTLSAWLWWRFGAWVAQRMALPTSMIEPGIFVAWMLPAVLIAIAMLASSRPVIDRALTMGILSGEQERGGQ